jgi:hypothetical protein
MMKAVPKKVETMEFRFDPNDLLNDRAAKALQMLLTMNIGLIGALKDNGSGQAANDVRAAVNKALERAKGNRLCEARANIADLKYLLAAAMRAMVEELEAI